MILFNYSSTASSTTAIVSVAEPVTVEVQAAAIGARSSGVAAPVKVALKLNNNEISSAENNVGAAATPISVTAEASVGMQPGQQYKLEVVGTVPPNCRLISISLKGTIGGQTGGAAAGVADAKVKPRKGK